MLEAVTKASKLPTPAQFRARQASRKDKREYPVFHQRMSVAEYVTAFYGLNAEAFKGWTQDNFRKVDSAKMVAGFFEPLSTNPQFSQPEQSVEEDIV